MLRRNWYKGLLALFIALNIGFIAAPDANAAWTRAGEWGTCACTPGPNPPEQIAFCLIGLGEECTDDDQCDTDHCD
jgi:hypothetical protein